MADLSATTRELLRSGAPIQDMNTVRKHLSAIQGGRLAAASRAPVVALIISDVTGDDPTHIASGPCAPDPTTYRDAIDILERFEVRAPAPVAAAPRARRARRARRNAQARRPRFQARREPRDRLRAASLEAAARYFASARHTPGHTRRFGHRRSARSREGLRRARARSARTTRAPWPPPVALISGGECTVTVRGDGRGGRCAEFLLSLAIDLDGARRHPRARLRHRRHRRLGRQRRRDPRAGRAEARGGEEARPGGAARDKRRLRLFLGARRARRHRPDPHQRQRLPRHPDQ